jgi:hypothetical protein
MGHYLTTLDRRSEEKDIQYEECLCRTSKDNAISLPVPVERKMVIRVPISWVIIAEE